MEEVGYQLAYSKQELKKVINCYPGKEVNYVQNVFDWIVLFAINLTRQLSIHIVYRVVTNPIDVGLFCWNWDTRHKCSFFPR